MRTFAIRPEDIRCMVLPGTKRIRAWAKLTEGALAHEASAEADDIVSAVGKALECALEAWFDKGRFSAMPNASMINADGGWLCSAFVFGRLAIGCVTGACTERGEARHADQATAAALAYVAAINALIARCGIDAFVAPTSAPPPHPA